MRRWLNKARTIEEIGESLRALHLELQQHLRKSGDLMVPDPVHGLVLVSPNGTNFRFRVDDAGNLITPGTSLGTDPPDAGIP